MNLEFFSDGFGVIVIFNFLFIRIVIKTMLITLDYGNIKHKRFFFLNVQIILDIDRMMRQLLNYN